MWWSLKRKKMYSETWIEFHWLLGVWIQFRLSQNHAHLLFTYHNRSYNNTSADGSACTYMPTMMVSASMLWQHMPAPWNQATASYYPSYMDAIKLFGVLCRNENGNEWNENRQLTNNVWVCVCLVECGWIEKSWAHAIRWKRRLSILEPQHFYISHTRLTISFSTNRTANADGFTNRFNRLAQMGHLFVTFLLIAFHLKMTCAFRLACP